MAFQPAEHPMYARELSQTFGIHTEAEIRAMMRRAENPLPHVTSGSKRPHMKAFPSVYLKMLGYEMEVCPYAEVEQAAGRVPIGALQ